MTPASLDAIAARAAAAPRVLWSDEDSEKRAGLRLVEIGGKARLQIARLIKYDPPTYDWWGLDQDLPGVHGYAVLEIANERDALLAALREARAEIATLLPMLDADAFTITQLVREHDAALAHVAELEAEVERYRKACIDVARDRDIGQDENSALEAERDAALAFVERFASMPDTQEAMDGLVAQADKLLAPPVRDEGGKS